MSILALRDELNEQMLAFAWDEWAQMGVLTGTGTGGTDRWAADPEALLLFGLELGREDPRLFDELLDWLLVNERLISTQRLRNLAQDAEDRALVEAALAWSTSERSPAADRRATGRKNQAARSATALFRSSSAKIATPEESFLRHGLIRAPIAVSKKSCPPQLERPINFAFRLRALLGVGARAEAIRTLLGTHARTLPVQQIAHSAAYAKRNVQEALALLHAAGAIEALSAGNERRYSIDKERWAHLLAIDASQLPVHREWIALFGVLRRIVRWFANPDNEQLSDYMRASRARELVEAITPSLQAAGVVIRTDGPAGEEYWTEFTDIARAAVRALRIGR
jgi:hypothetical protein